jgi:plastocyanin
MPLTSTDQSRGSARHVDRWISCPRVAERIRAGPSVLSAAGFLILCEGLTAGGRLRAAKAASLFHFRVMLPKLLVVIMAAAGVSCASEPAPPAPPSEVTVPKNAAGRTLVTGKATPGAVVTLEPTTSRDFQVPTETAVMDQYGLAFNPDFLVARVGQRVEFRSSEDALHNVRVAESDTNTTVFNVATPPNQAYTHVFEKPGYYDVTCDIHPAMRASVFVTSTPYTGVADEAGTFTFRDVDPGDYKLTALAGGRQIDQIVHVSGSRTDVTLRNP